MVKKWIIRAEGYGHGWQLGVGREFDSEDEAAAHVAAYLGGKMTPRRIAPCYVEIAAVYRAPYKSELP